ncbi:MAG: hypothetical protein WCS31_04470 [Verrucomicrobiae bacterium]
MKAPGFLRGADARTTVVQKVSRQERTDGKLGEFFLPGEAGKRCP